MTLKPIGDHILIKPLANPEQTESGLHLVEHYKPETQGEVIAVGPCAHPRKDEIEKLAAELQEQSDLQMEPGYYGNLFGCAAERLRELVAREPEVKVGDHVLFSWNVGQEILINEERYLLLHESDITAILEFEGA